MVATVLPWREARPAIIVVSLAAMGIALAKADTFAIIMAVMAFALAWSVGIAMEQAGMRERLRRAGRTAVLACVAAERERIGRDLHDILGHSLTIAIKADLVERLIGRDGDRRPRRGGCAGRGGAPGAGRRPGHRVGDARGAAGRRGGLGALRMLQTAGVECRTPSALPVLDAARSELFGYAWCARPSPTWCGTRGRPPARSPPTGVP